MKVCDRCGNIVSWSKPYCPLCGNDKLKDVASPDEPNATPSLSAPPAQPNEAPLSPPIPPELTDLPGLPVVDRGLADSVSKRDQPAPIFALDEEDVADASAPPSLGEGISTHRTMIGIKPDSAAKSNDFSQFPQGRLAASPTTEARTIPGIDLTKSPQPANAPTAPSNKIPGLEYLNDITEKDTAPPKPVQQPEPLVSPSPGYDTAPAPVSRIPGLEYLNDDQPEVKTSPPVKTEPPALTFEPPMEAPTSKIPGLDYIEPEIPPQLPTDEPVTIMATNTVVCPVCGAIVELSVGYDGRISITEREPKGENKPSCEQEERTPPLVPTAPTETEPQGNSFVEPLPPQPAPLPPTPYQPPNPPAEQKLIAEAMGYKTTSQEGTPSEQQKAPDKENAPYLEGEFLKMFPEARGGR